MLVEPDDVWIGVSRLNEFERIPRRSTGYDWNRVTIALREHKASALFIDTDRIEIAGASTTADPVAYHTLITAMDVALKAGFSDVGITDPNSLSAQPQR